MSKLSKITIANTGILLLYVGGFLASYCLGVPINELLKLIPTESASAIGTVITLSVALNSSSKEQRLSRLGNPSKKLVCHCAVVY